MLTQSTKLTPLVCLDSNNPRNQKAISPTDRLELTCQFWHSHSLINEVF